MVAPVFKASQIRNKAIRHLQTYYSSSEDKNKVLTKFNNISGKTARYFVHESLWQKRTARKNRALLPFKDVVEHNMTMEELEKFAGGVAVEFTNNDFFDQYFKPEEEQLEIFKKLAKKLGSDDNVSSIIVIRSVGESSSSEQRKAYSQLHRYLISENITELNEILIRRKPKEILNYSGMGNDKWQGYLFIDISGGQQESFNAHREFGISPSEIQLFNPAVEYATSEVSDDITITLTYFALHAVPVAKRTKEWLETVNEIYKYLDSREYDDGKLSEYVDNHISLNLSENKVLTDAMLGKPITLEQFVVNSTAPNSLDLSHEQAVSLRTYVWDQKQQLLLTAARPTNLFWMSRESNLMQQELGLEEAVRKRSAGLAPAVKYYKKKDQAAKKEKRDLYYNQPLF